jgi:hypothetical protein
VCEPFHWDILVPGICRVFVTGGALGSIDIAGALRSMPCCEGSRGLKEPVEKRFKGGQRCRDYANSELDKVPDNVGI